MFVKSTNEAEQGTSHGLGGAPRRSTSVRWYPAGVQAVSAVSHFGHLCVPIREIGRQSGTVGLTRFSNHLEDLTPQLGPRPLRNAKRPGELLVV